MRIAGALVVVAVLATGCSAAPAPPAPPAVPPSSPAPATTPVAPAGLAERGRAAEAYAAGRGGVVGIVVRDRTTGEVFRSAAAGRPFRAASVVKLAIAVDLLARARSGEIRLGAADGADLRAMLVRSDNAATDRLWDRFGGAAIGARFAAYGLTGATGTARWGTVRCTPDDLARLVGHVLERTDPADRATLLGLLRAVEEGQRWGVLGLSAELDPAAKNGWTPSGAGWALASAGVAGPGERWTVAVMAELPGEFLTGVAAVTGTVTTLFLGLS